MDFEHGSPANKQQPLLPEDFEPAALADFGRITLCRRLLTGTSLGFDSEPVPVQPSAVGFSAVDGYQGCKAGHGEGYREANPTVGSQCVGQ